MTSVPSAKGRPRIAAAGPFHRPIGECLQAGSGLAPAEVSSSAFRFYRTIRSILFQFSEGSGGSIFTPSDDGRTGRHRHQPMECPMSRILTVSVLALSLAAGVTGAASAQSYNAPAGIPAATAPGGQFDATGTARHSTARDSRLGTLSTDSLTTGSVQRARTAR
jgi:hypothetical protein